MQYKGKVPIINSGATDKQIDNAIAGLQTAALAKFQNWCALIVGRTGAPPSADTQRKVAKAVCEHVQIADEVFGPWLKERESALRLKYQ